MCFEQFLRLLRFRTILSILKCVVYVDMLYSPSHCQRPFSINFSQNNLSTDLVTLEIPFGQSTARVKEDVPLTRFERNQRYQRRVTHTFISRMNDLCIGTIILKSILSHLRPLIRGGVHVIPITVQWKCEQLNGINN